VQVLLKYLPEHIRLHLKFADGNYLYKNKFQIHLLNSSTQQLGLIEMPSGISKHSQILGNFEAYVQDLSITIPLANTAATTLSVHYQGCAKSGFCYPPQTRLISLANGKITITDPDKITVNQQDTITRLLDSRNIVLILVGFLGFGLLLAFTPCVFPMIPILSGLIVGQQQSLTTQKAFYLSLAYVLAMAITYAAAGITAAYAGSYLQGMLQTPWAISLFSGVFVVLALSLFGLYDLQLPTSLQQKLIKLSNRQRGGQYLGVMLMGSLSTLIVSPCVSAPLVGALGYIGQTGDAILGGSALFMLGLGMGLPLLIIGTSASKLLPKAGGWLNLVKQIFGVILLAVAIELLSRIIPEWLTYGLWALLGIGVGSYLILYKKINIRWQKIVRLLGIIVLSISSLFAVKLSMISFNPKLAKDMAAKSPLTFQMINSATDLSQALTQAKLIGKPVILDFYADWCASCKDIEQNVLTDPTVQDKLQHYLRLRANVTQLTQQQKHLMQNLQVIAPPTFVFFANNQELTQYRLVGEIKAQAFTKQLQAILGDK
jgi:thiol:disulfide interchange protein DsbD